MFGWYVDIGVPKDPSIANWTDVYSVAGHNISDFNIVDTNRPFTILESTKISNPYDETYISSGTNDAVYEKLLDLFGIDQVSSIYAIPGQYRNGDPDSYDGKNSYKKYQEYIPSIFLSYPNVWKEYTSMEDSSGYTTTLYTAIINRKNRRALIGSPEVVHCYTYDEDGVLSWPNIRNSNTCVNSFGRGVLRPIYFNGQFPNGYGGAIDIELKPNNSSTYLAKLSSQDTIDVIKFLFDETPIAFDYPIQPPPDNPYGPGGSSGTGGGGGTFDNESDIIGIPPLPTLSSANTGFTRIYNPTLAQVQDLARYLWTDETVVQTIWNHIKQYFENPMDAIIGFNLVPVAVPDGGTKEFALMYINTGVSMNVAANQFVDVDCGELKIEPYYGSALDHSPYTKISCYLPFIGTVSLNVDEVMGTTLKVVYRVDICSGSCVAYITVNNIVMYQYSGHCAINIPLAAADFSSYVNAAISVAKLAGAAITAGAGVAMATGVAEAAQQTNQVVTTTQVTNTARNPSTGRQITTGTTTTVETRESPADQSSTQASFGGLSPQNVSNTVGAVMSSKPHIEHTGSFSGNSGYLGVRRPFIIIERPNMCMPENYQALNGFPAMITMELSTCKGFTRVQQVQLTGMGRATNPEQAEILELLKLGVIL